ncbi:MAG: ABC transporter permease [Oscillospiraceae bacterium]|nr:ABC transporter permease [Oscillospiraceae bacterium]MBQ3542492.1 ABC transporter permease [Oscillospiraceae bacterium]
MKNNFGSRLGSMLKVDFRRMFKSKLFYILLACALVMPILMTVMMAMMDGSVTVDPQTGVESVMVGPENTWQNIGTLPGGEAMGGMDVFAMCNINMIFMIVSVFICLFISDDFRSGFAKNLFTVRAKKGDYMISKTLAGFLCGALMLILYFVGAVLGGAIAGLSFDLHGLTTMNLVMCMLAKIFLMPVFVSIFVLISIAAKQKAWLSICGSLGGGMLLFMMVGLITPLGSTMLNVVLCLAGSAMFAIGLGIASKAVLNKTSLV